MAANKELPLEIKQFAGIDRFDRGTVTPPNFFQTMNGYHIPSSGEIATIGGIEDLSGADLPGVQKIIHQAIHKDFGGREKLLNFFIPSIDGDTDFGEGLISGSDFSVVDAPTGGSKFYYVVLYGPGGCYKVVEITTSTTSDIMRFTVPSGIPDYICQINIYQAPSNIGITNGGLVASLNRRQSDFPASVDFVNVLSSVTTADAGVSSENQITPDHFVVQSYGDSGSLIPGKTYYTGVSSNVVASGSATPLDPGPFGYTYPRIRLYDVATNPLAFTLPEGKNSATVKYFFCSNMSGGELNIAGREFYNVWSFLGATNEDVLVSGDTEGAYSAKAVSSKTVNFDPPGFLAITVSVADDSFTQTPDDFTLDDESPVVFTTSDSGNKPGGLTDNGVYYIKYTLGKNTFVLYDSLADLKQGGAPVTITSTGSNYTAHNFEQVSLEVTYNHMTYNSNNGINMTESLFDNPRSMGGTYQQADNNRLDGVFVNSQFYPSVTDAAGGNFSKTYNAGADLVEYPLNSDSSDMLGCWVLDAETGDTYQLLANVNEKNFSITGSKKLAEYTGETKEGSLIQDPGISPSLLWAPADEIISTNQFTIRTYIGNGDNTLFQTNGYVLKPMIRSNGKQRVPTSKYVWSFASRLVCGGGVDSFQNSSNQVYYSEPDLPFDWGAGAPNTLNVFSGQDINGFASYSQNLTTSGFAQYLFISKKDGAFTWDGDTSNGAEQLYYGFGMASPQSFIETDFGPIFVSRENIYMLQQGNFTEIGDNVEPILRQLSDDQLSKIVATYHDKICKIGYPSVEGGALDRELWLELRTERGRMNKIITGPHELLPYNSQAATIIFGEDRDQRFSCSDTRIFKRDSGTDNNGSSISRKLVIDRLHMKNTHLRKLLTQIYIATQVNQNETFNLTLDFEDGSEQYTGTLKALLKNTRQLSQHMIRSRPWGRIASLTIENTSNKAHSIFNISLMHELQQRRLLRYK